MRDELDTQTVIADTIDRRASPEEKLKGRLMYAECRNISKVARMLKRKRATVSAWMIGPEFEAVKKDVEARLFAEQRDHVLHQLRELRDDSLRGMKRAIREGSARGNHKPALETLLHARLLDPIVVEDSPRVVVQIGIKDSDVSLGPTVVKKEP